VHIEIDGSDMPTPRWSYRIMSRSASRCAVNGQVVSSKRGVSLDDAGWAATDVTTRPSVTVSASPGATRA
jgi:hypothetical protein